MNRHLLRLLIMSFLLACLLGSQAGQPARADCKQIIAPGDWTGTIEHVITGHKTDPQINFDSTGRTTGILNLKVDQCNGITGTIDKLHTDFEYHISGLVSQSDTCTFDGGLTVVSGTVESGDGGLPLLTLKYHGDATVGLCGEPTDATNADLILQAEYATSSHLAGNKAKFTDPNMQIGLTNLAQSGVNVTLTDHWELNTAGPSLDEITPQYVRYFLRELPLQNQYTTQVDWNGSPPGKVTFTLAGQSKDAVVSGNTASQTFEIGSLPAGNNQLTAIATAGNNSASAPVTHDVILVPQELWAKSAGFSGSPEGDHIIYTGKVKFPEQPLGKSITLPDYIPFIGGAWGILPTQLNVAISATSAGGIKNDKITGTGGVGLGGHQFPLEVSGASYTNMTPTELQFMKSTAYLKLPPASFSKQVGLITLIPGADALFNFPVIGKLLQSVNGIASVTGNITTSLSGKGEIEPKPDLSALVFTSGKVNTDAQVSVMTALDLGLAWAYVQGGGNGSVTYELVPKLEPVDCMVSLFFEAAAGLADFFHVPPAVYHKDWTITQCTGSADNGSGPLALRLPQPGVTRIQAKKAASQSASGGLADETLLAENASAHARPALAASPDGKLAFAWMAVDPSGAKPGQIALRIFNGQDWAQPILLSPDGRAAFTPALGFDMQGRVVVVWAENKSESAPAALDEAYARGMEIVYAVVDPAAGSVTDRGSLTGDDALDFTPQVVRDHDGYLWAAWQSSPFASLAGGQGAPNQLKAAWWDGKKWSKVQTAAGNLVGTVWWSLAAGSGDALLAYDVDTDGDLSTAADREIFAVTGRSSWGRPFQVSENNLLDTAPRAAYTAEGQPLLAWLRDGKEVVGLQGSLTEKPQVWLDAQQGPGLQLGEGILLGGSGGRLGLVLPGAASGAPDVWLFSYDPETQGWTRQSQPLFASGDLHLALSAVLAQNGDLLLGAAHVPVLMQEQKTAGGAVLKTPQISGKASLAFARLKDAFPQQTGAQPGSADWWRLPLVAGLTLLCCSGLLAVLVIALLAGRRKRAT